MLLIGREKKNLFPSKRLLIGHLLNDILQPLYALEESFFLALDPKSAAGKQILMLMKPSLGYGEQGVGANACETEYIARCFQRSQVHLCPWKRKVLGHELGIIVRIETALPNVRTPHMCLLVAYTAIGEYPLNDYNCFVHRNSLSITLLPYDLPFCLSCCRAKKSYAVSFCCAF